MIDLSIIIPVYNVEKYLKECLNSILDYNHSFKLEVIIINDGSTDNSDKIAKEYERNFSNVRVFHKENGGLSSARNLGIREASGEYITFIDSDDFIKNEGLEKLLEYAKDYNLDLIRGKYLLYFDSNQSFLDRNKECDFDGIIMEGSDYIQKSILLNNFEVVSCTTIYKKIIYFKMDYFLKKAYFSKITTLH
ncbi:glycosyltransferase family 2 protein [Bacillus sp. N9]